MEKTTPHTKLAVVKALIAQGKYRLTNSARAGASAVGFDEKDIIRTINSLTTKDHHKSMTTYENNKIWQEVYLPHTEVGQLYVKFTVIDDCLIVSFKEK